MPLVREAFDWEHGVFLGATMSAETTAAAAGTVGELRFDPMAMLPFCGYNMADYFGHWLKLGSQDGAQMPGIFYVNWFRKDEDGKFLWPGFGENSRVLEWVFRRLDGDAEARETPTGRVPRPEDLNTAGLDLAPDKLEALLSVDTDGLREELEQVREHLAKFGDGSLLRSARSSRRWRRGWHRLGGAVSLAEETEAGSSPASRLLELIDERVPPSARRRSARSPRRTCDGSRPTHPRASRPRTSSARC